MLRTRLAFGFAHGSGRATAANYLAGKINGAHAKSIYQPMHRMVNFGEQQLQHTVSNRDLLVKKLTRVWGLHDDNLVWPKYLVQDLRPEPVFIYDLEWPCHARYLQEHGYKIVKIDRDGCGLDLTPRSVHTVEDNLNWDLVIKNNGTIDEYYLKLDQAIENIVNK